MPIFNHLMSTLSISSLSTLSKKLVSKASMQKTALVLITGLSLVACSTQTYVSEENLDKFAGINVEKFLIAEIVTEIKQILPPNKKVFISLISHFDFDSSLLKDEDKMELDKLIALVNSLDGKLVIKGHTDYQGSNAYNENLSMRRARTIQDYLEGQLTQGEYEYSVEHFGELQPIIESHTLQANALNRRAMVIFTEK
ncbi:OmpA family protein [Shewanella violacea]|uniref:OmpA family protein n=1 Tax=Shewanella violacea (strain JCM 10179 / CIP 106290 / LMG 19151 / DSS12) TaxID=637905 RepID=D4ZJ50_SHEVD|nr:OmpA family protein [Shewanella violacea]BAJ01699.1 OmpA family protein [Shewanella violacea DSS12]